MSGLLLRLAGPLQSWGERSAFNPVRDTASFPTRSALVGLFAAAEGIGRDDGGLDRYDTLRITVRVDRPGIRLTDYHTVGGGQPKARTAATSGGSNKGAAVITERHYLSDAVFVVAVSGPKQTLAPLAGALRRPHWAPYLGRRSCPPDEPFVLRHTTDDPESELLTGVPLSRSTPRGGGADDTVAVEFLREEAPAGSTADRLDLYDMPVSFARHGRSHGMRSLYRTLEDLPATLTSPQPQQLQRLIDYAQTEDRA
ncbi:type I-E CRISPR-associated protein Cas5/CasD [Streptomyces sp. NPDC058202]|uniref:type I-E CRISPR-associated protein Cas5/CasD n=1 Tax=Streptomyces sp. NPDC058202 TaxID=3346380 RepID=UPI0036E06BA3